MPIKSRLILDEIQSLENTKTKLSDELETAENELQKRRDLVIKGKLETDDLVNQNVRVDALRETIATIVQNIADAKDRVDVERRAEKRRAAVRQIVSLDKNSEKLAKRYLAIWSDVENISYSKIVELNDLQNLLNSDKHLLFTVLSDLFPNINGSSYYHGTEGITALEAFMDELRANGCVLNVLLSEMFSDVRLPVNSLISFQLPEHELNDWIVFSIRAIKANEERKKIAFEIQEQVSPSVNPQKKFVEKIQRFFS